VTYDVWISGSGATNFYSGEKVSSRQTGTTFDVGGLDYNTEYKWKVVAYDESGDERSSGVAYFTTVADTTPPTGSVQINGGAATTDSYTVTLNIPAADGDSGLKYMRASNNGVNWTYWRFYSDTWSAWNLADRDYGGTTGGVTHSVYVQFRDSEDNVSATYSDTIDKTDGTPGVITLNGVVYETIRDAMTNAVSGDIVQLSPGTWSVECEVWPPRYPTTSVGIVMADGVTLRGSGAGATKLVNACAYTIIDAHDAVIEGLTIVNENAIGRDAVLLESNNSTIRNCIVRDSGDAGIVIWNGTNCEISNNLIINNDYGITSNSSGTNYVYNNTIASNNEWGVLYSDFDDFRNNNICFNGNEGVTVSTGVTFTYNNVYGNAGGNYDGGSNLTDQTGINGNLSVDPGFVDMSGYRLSSGSLVVNQGTDVGIPYDGAAPDMGAFEYDAQTATVNVSANQAGASYTLNGESGSYTGSGASWSQNNLPAGYYTIYWNPLSGFYTPESETLFLYSGQTIGFTGEYVADAEGPTGEISVQYDHYVTMVPFVDIVLDVTDPVGGLETGAQMRFSNDGVTWSTPEPYSDVKLGWDLAGFGGDAGSGSKIVYAQVADALGNWSLSITDSILYLPDRTIHEVPYDYLSIQMGVDAAADGDLVLVHEGTYTEDVLLTSGVSLQAVDNSRVLVEGTIYTAENTLVDGFGISNTSDGVISYDNSAIVSNNIIFEVGEGINIGGTGEPIIRNNVIHSCAAPITVFSGSSPHISNNTLDNSTGDSIYIQNSEYPQQISITNNILTNADYGIRISTADLQHNTVFTEFNQFFGNIGVDYLGPTTAYEVGPGENNDDPLYMDAASFDYSLQEASSAINNGNPLGRFIDHDNTVNDKGFSGAKTFNSPPVAIFSANSSTTTPREVTFDATNSFDYQTDANYLRYRWDFDGDGAFDTSFATTNSQVTHQFAATGDFLARLQVMDQYGMMGTYDQVVSSILPNYAPDVPNLLAPSDGAQDIASDVTTLTWSCVDANSTDILTYRLYLGHSSDPPLFAVDVQDTSMDVAFLGYNEVYFWRVVAVDNAGAETSSIVGQFFTEDVQSPDAPANLEAVLTGSQQVQLTWDDASWDESGFILERKTGEAGDWGQIGQVRTNADSFTDVMGLVPDNTYYYRVSAFNQGGTASATPEVSVHLPNTAPEIDPIVESIETDWLTPESVDLVYYLNDLTDTLQELSVVITDVNTAIFDVSQVDHQITIVPRTGISGSDDILLTLTDSGGLTDEQWVTVSIAAPNTTPVWSAIPSQSVFMDSENSQLLDLWSYVEDDMSADSDLTLSITSISDTGCGVQIASGRWISVYPDSGFLGDCTVTLRASNGVNGADTAIVVSVLDVDGTCANPRLVDTTPYADAFSLTGMPGSVSVYGTGCSGSDFYGGDVVYQLDAEVGQAFSVTVEPVSPLDAALGVLPQCAEDTPCTHWMDNYGPGGSEAVTLSATASTTYYLVVEGVYTTGDFTLTVDALPEFCWIGEQSYTQGEANPLDECEVCNTAVSRVFWTAVTGTISCGGAVDTSIDTADADTADTNTFDTDTVDTATLDVDTVDTTMVDVDTVDTTMVDVDTVDTTTVDVNTVDTTMVDVDTVDTTTVDVDTVDTATLDADSVDRDTADTDAAADSSLDTSDTSGGDETVQDVDSTSTDSSGITCVPGAMRCDEEMTQECLPGNNWQDRDDCLLQDMTCSLIQGIAQCVSENASSDTDSDMESSVASSSGCGCNLHGSPTAGGPFPNLLTLLFD
ncbi:MAG: right-handed parallel beta-helix repeat-containing protein, partial [Deltaproteobacteria bacterium]|nr:right-handed parallel beta-helix repeat-containing protein [Deltaproteobacteria bacterium]